VYHLTLNAIEIPCVAKGVSEEDSAVTNTSSIPIYPTLNANVKTHVYHAMLNANVKTHVYHAMLNANVKTPCGPSVAEC
jgi:hypothetical protein